MLVSSRALDVPPALSRVPPASSCRTATEHYLAWTSMAFTFGFSIAPGLN